MAQSTSEDDFLLPVGTVTLLLADVAGSSRLWEEEPEETARALDRLDALVGDLVGRHAGVRPIEAGGRDSFVAAFSRASDALHCAVALQIAVRDDTLRLRVGLHTGEVQMRGEGNYVGTAVNRTARLRDIAHGGQTVMSAATRDLLVDRLPEAVSLEDLGTHRLRDLARAEHVFQLCHPDLKSDFPPLRSLDDARHNLPLQLSSFIGRADELATVRQLVSEARLLTLTGSGGCGKTRLALQVAADALDDFGDGAWFCPLGPLTDAAAVTQSVAGALSVKEETGSALRDTLLRYLRNMRLLLVLDNCEHVAAACAELVDVVLRDCPAVTVLATSRELLGVEGEVLWRVPSLSLPPESEPPSIEATSTSDAVALFVDRARSVRPNFVMTDESAALVLDLCRRLDAIPLAIELAAARVRVLPLEQIVAGLADRFRLLGAGPRTALPRQQTLLASVAWSYDLLPEEEKSLLRRVAVFAGGFTLDAAEAVCAGETIDQFKVLELLSTLADRSLVVVADQAPHFRLLETIKQFAWERLVDAGDAAAYRDRHLEFYAARSRGMFDTPSSELMPTFDAMDHDYENVRAALAWGATEDRLALGLELAAPLFFYWLLRGRYTEGRRVLDDLLARADGADPQTRAWASFGSAWLANFTGELLAMIPLLHQALALAREVGDLRIEAACGTVLGQAKALTMTPADGLPEADAGLELARRAGHDWVLAGALFGAGHVRALAGDLRGAQPFIEESIEAAMACGFPAWYGMTALGTFRCYWGDFVAAEEVLRPALAMARNAGDHFYTANALQSLSAVTGARGHPGAFRSDLQEELQWAEETNSSLLIGTIKNTLGFTSWAEADYERTVALGEELLALSRVLPGATPLLSARSTLAWGFLGLGRFDDAAAQVAEVMQALPDADHSPGGYQLPLLNSFVAAAADDLVEAERQVLVGLGNVGADYKVIARRYLARLGCIWVGLGRDVDGVRLLSAADAFNSARGIVPIRFDLPQIEAALHDARAVLSPDAFTKAWDDGSTLTLPDAIAYVRRGRGPRKRPASGWDSITPAEMQVVELVAAGLANAEIAERLFISRRTVGSHLNHIFAKLAVKSRTELAAAANRRGR